MCRTSIGLAKSIECYKRFFRPQQTLVDVNYPDKFKILFYTKYDYIKDRRYFILVDISDWGLVPPPEFNVTASPPSLDLKPNEN